MAADKGRALLIGDVDTGRNCCNDTAWKPAEALCSALGITDGRGLCCCFMCCCGPERRCCLAGERKGKFFAPKGLSQASNCIRPSLQANTTPTQLCDAMPPKQFVLVTPLYEPACMHRLTIVRPDGSEVTMLTRNCKRLDALQRRAAQQQSCILAYVCGPLNLLQLRRCQAKHALEGRL